MEGELLSGADIFAHLPQQPVSFFGYHWWHSCSGPRVRRCRRRLGDSGGWRGLGACNDVALQRPGGLYVEWSGDLGDRQFWYDGKSVTLYDPATPFYATDAAPRGHRRHAGESGDAAWLRSAAGRPAVSRPVSRRARQCAVRVRSRGDQREWRSCHALAFVEKDIDWQIWIDAGAATDALQAGDHLQDAAVAAAVHCGVHRLGLRAAHRCFGVRAGGAAWDWKRFRFKLSLAANRGREHVDVQATVVPQRDGLPALLAGVGDGGMPGDGADRAAAFRGGFGGGGGFHGGGFGGFHGGGFGGFHGGGFGGFHGFGGRFGGFHGGGWGGASRFGDGGSFDRSGDAGFGGGGWGSVHNASSFSDHADSFQQSHPQFHQNTSQFQEAHPEARQNASQYQQNRFNEANSLQQNRFNEANNLQYNRTTTWNNYNAGWGGYYSGLGFGAGLAIGAAIAALPAAAYALTVAGSPYWYSNGVYYAQQGGSYVVAAPPIGAVVPAPPPSCYTVDLAAGKTYDCGGAFYSSVPNGYEVIPPPIGVSVHVLPNGAVDQTIGGVTYFTYGGAWYRPMYSAGGVSYMVVKKPG